MFEIRPFDKIGQAQHGWLDAHHHFSFASYMDRARMQWGSIRVWNDDIIAPHTGFAPHGHQDMEIITYVRSGAISHEDSMGNKGITRAGDVQVMSAGSGVQHSEYNHENEPCTLFQIWILPAQRGGAPGYGNREFPKGNRAGQWVVLASGMGETRGGGDSESEALEIRTPARVMGALLKAGDSLTHEVEAGRHAYLVPATGKIMVKEAGAGESDGMNAHAHAHARDGVAMKSGLFTFTALEESELVLVDAA
jgi:quercetin 2,3-dioxygenase